MFSDKYWEKVHYNMIETNNVKKECYLIRRQYYIKYFDKIIFFNYRIKQMKASETIYVSFCLATIKV